MPIRKFPSEKRLPNLPAPSPFTSGAFSFSFSFSCSIMASLHRSMMVSPNFRMSAIGFSRRSASWAIVSKRRRGLLNLLKLLKNLRTWNIMGRWEKNKTGSTGGQTLKKYTNHDQKLEAAQDTAYTNLFTHTRHLVCTVPLIFEATDVDLILQNRFHGWI